VGQGVEITGEPFAGVEGSGKSDILSLVLCLIDSEIDVLR
jgi:hypothetical protein